MRTNNTSPKKEDYKPDVFTKFCKVRFSEHELNELKKIIDSSGILADPKNFGFVTNGQDVLNKFMWSVNNMCAGNKSELNISIIPWYTDGGEHIFCFYHTEKFGEALSLNFLTNN